MFDECFAAPDLGPGPKGPRPVLQTMGALPSLRTAHRARAAPRACSVQPCVKSQQRRGGQ